MDFAPRRANNIKFVDYVLVMVLVHWPYRRMDSQCDCQGQRRGAGHQYDCGHHRRFAGRLAGGNVGLDSHGNIRNAAGIGGGRDNSAHHLIGHNAAQEHRGLKREKMDRESVQIGKNFGDSFIL